jgi:hypothetical protein
VDYKLHIFYKKHLINKICKDHGLERRKLSINEKKVIKKKLTVKKMGAKLKKSIFSKNKKSK